MEGACLWIGNATLHRDTPHHDNTTPSNLPTQEATHFLLVPSASPLVLSPTNTAASHPSPPAGRWPALINAQPPPSNNPSLQSIHHPPSTIPPPTIHHPYTTPYTTPSTRYQPPKPPQPASQPAKPPPQPSSLRTPPRANRPIPHHPTLPNRLLSDVARDSCDKRREQVMYGAAAPCRPLARTTLPLHSRPAPARQTPSPSCFPLSYITHVTPPSPHLI